MWLVVMLSLLHPLSEPPSLVAVARTSEACHKAADHLNAAHPFGKRTDDPDHWYACFRIEGNT